MLKAKEIEDKTLYNILCDSLVDVEAASSRPQKQRNSWVYNCSVVLYKNNTHYVTQYNNRYVNTIIGNVVIYKQ